MTGHASTSSAAAIAEARRLCAEAGVDVTHLTDEELIDAAGAHAYRGDWMPLTQWILEERERDA